MSDTPPVSVPPVLPTPLPPNTSPSTFWERSATKVALVETVVLVNAIVRPYVVSRFGEPIALLAEGAEWAWLMTFGIQRTDGNSLRWR